MVYTEQENFLSVLLRLPVNSGGENKNTAHYCTGAQYKSYTNPAHTAAMYSRYALDSSPPHGAPLVALDGKDAAFSARYLPLSPVAVPPTPSHPLGSFAMGNFGVVYRAGDRAAAAPSGAPGPAADVAIKYTKSKSMYDRLSGTDVWVDRYPHASHHHAMVEEAHVHRRATHLGSAHIVRLLGAYEVDVELGTLVVGGHDMPGRRPRLALVMEFFPGQNLRHVMMQSEKLPGVLSPTLTTPAPRVRAYNEVDKRNMFAPICQAVLELHRAGIVHRDIKRACA
jgi:hypothetical protein